ncbi:MAG TPA: flavodoxin domain-containing protein [Methanomicrobiales archaeon]|nr:flavodoxin domain-containing protein [Methanomicrobiales archaeon]
MAGKVLIAYATRMGSTAEIAQAVGRELEATGLGVEVARLKDVGSIGGFTAIVIGSPVYMTQIEKDVAVFIARHGAGLSRVPVAAFAVGLAPVDHRVGSVGDVLDKFRAALGPVKPVAITMFAGRLELARMSFVQRTVTGLMKVFTGDFRDWEAVRVWARGLPAVFGL